MTQGCQNGGDISFGAFGTGKEKFRFGLFVLCLFFILGKKEVLFLFF